MPAGTVLDYSGARPTDQVLQQMKDFGVVGVVRYPYLGPGTEWKAIQPFEYQHLTSFGFSVALTPELSANTWRGGKTKGIEVGRMAREWATRIGFPTNRPMHFAVDENVLLSELSIALNYLEGCAIGGGQVSAAGRQSAYGETSVIDAAYDRGITCNGWRAAALSWDQTPSRRASLRQTTQRTYPLPIAYDENIIEDADWGQHDYIGASMAAPVPFTLYKDAAQKVWRVDSGGQSRTLVPDLSAIAFNFDQLQQVFGFSAAECQVRDATQGEAKRWLATIPIAGIVNVNVPPCPPVPTVFEITKAVLDAMSARLTS